MVPWESLQRTTMGWVQTGLSWSFALRQRLTHPEHLIHRANQAVQCLRETEDNILVAIGPQRNVLVTRV